MCGIAGIATRNGTPPDEGMLRRMATAIAHRGPDGEGIWVAPGVGLAHRRLSIIDLSSGGSQPMADMSGRFHITFNGEIYNYRDLRAELERNGVRFRSQSDTEAILEGYRAWGRESFTKLRGMFAFALWDAEKKALTLVRDRIGKKPLYYSETPTGFAFASEIKALREVVDLKPDWDDVRLFLGLQYVPTPRTGFVGVRQLEPGMIGVWEHGTWKTEQYHEWTVGCHSREGGNPESDRSRLDSCLRRNDKGGRNMIDDRIRSLLDDAVRLRVEASDVEVGAFLSGGVDSAAVVALAKQHAKQRMQTFTMGFDGPSAFDERDAAQETVRALGLNAADHHSFVVQPTDLLDCADELINHYDAPYADSSALPLWALSRETAKQVKVVLTGDGGDELFGGYRRYVWFQRACLAYKIPLSLFISAAALQPMFDEPKWRRFFETVYAMPRGAGVAYGELFCGAYFNSASIRTLCTPTFLEQTKNADAVQFVGARFPRPSGRSEGGVTPPLRDALFFDLTSYLPDDLNVKMDRATMRWGLEARSPLLDQELVTYALGLPLNQKVAHGKTKIALKRALRGIVPEAVLERPKKGFQVPLATWFRDPLRKRFEERCLSESSPLRSICRTEIIERLLKENDRGIDHGNRLWMLYALATWLERYG